MVLQCYEQMDIFVGSPIFDKIRTVTNLLKKKKKTTLK